MKYIWTEDTGAGLHFWNLVNQLFFDNKFVIESKESNQGILDALLGLKVKEGDEFFIAFDYVVDNQDILKMWSEYSRRFRRSFPGLDAARSREFCVNCWRLRMRSGEMR